MSTDLKGPLDPEVFGQILEKLEEGICVRSLLISDGVSEKIFYFSIGGIRLVSLGGRRGVYLGDVLISRGQLTTNQRDRVLDHAKDHEKSFGQASVDLGLLSRDAVEEAVTEQLKGELLDLRFWSDAEYEFREGQPPPQFYDEHLQAISLTCDVPEFISAVRSHLEAWSGAGSPLKTDRDTIEATESGREIATQERDSEDAKILKLCDGTRTLREVVEQAGLPSVQTYDILHSLFMGRLVTRRKDDELDPGLSREEILKVIRRLEASRSAMVGDLIVRSRLAKAYEQVGEAARAALVWKEIARIHRRRSNLKQTLAALQQAARLVPEDFRTREELLDLYRSMGELAKLLEEGKRLAEHLFKHNLLNRARNLLGGLINLAPQDLKLRKLYALTLLGLGEKSLALYELKKLAAILEKTDADPAELREVYRRILALDTRNRDYRQRLLKLTESRGSKWILRAGIAVAALILSVGGGSFLYELSARQSFPGQRGEIERLLAEHRFDAVRLRIREFRDKYQYSLVGRGTVELLGRIDAAEAEYLRAGLPADMKSADRAAKSGDLAAAVDAYSRIASLGVDKDPLIRIAQDRAEQLRNAESEAAKGVAEGVEYLNRGRLEAAVRVLGAVRSMYPTTRAASEIEFPTVITTIPPGAAVYKNGRLQPPSDPVILYSLQTRTRIKLEKEGFRDMVIDVEEILPADYHVYLEKETRWVAETGGPIEAEPAVGDGRVFVVSRDRYLYAFGEAEGEIIFRTCLGIAGDASGAPVLAGDTLYVGTSKGEVVAVDARFGGIRWREDLGAPIVAGLAPAAAGNVVLATIEDGRVAALKAESGNVMWVKDVGAAPGSTPETDGDKVYVGSARRRMISALRLTDGRTEWEVELPGAVTGPVARFGSYLCVGSEDKNVYSVHVGRREQTGFLRTSGPVRAQPVLDLGTVFVGSTDGGFYCQDVVRSDTLRWAKDLGNPVLGAAALTTTRVYVGSTNGSLFCLDRAGGDILWRFQTEAGIVSRPIIVGNTVYVTSMDGKLYAIED